MNPLVMEQNIDPFWSESKCTVNNTKQWFCHIVPSL